MKKQDINYVKSVINKMVAGRDLFLPVNNNVPYNYIWHVADYRNNIVTCGKQCYYKIKLSGTASRKFIKALAKTYPQISSFNGLISEDAPRFNTYRQYDIVLRYVYGIGFCEVIPHVSAYYNARPKDNGACEEDYDD